jgi:PhnB protein
MSTTAPGSEPVRTSIAPWLSVGRATDAVAHYEAAFGAVELYRMEDDTGRVQVAHLSIGEADFWVQQDDDAPGPESQDRRPIRMILTVDDPDTAFARAVAAGTTVVADVYEGHGWRVGRVADPFGHHWEIGKPLP